MKAPHRNEENVLNLSHTEAQEFFIENERYCSFDFPLYISFDSILRRVNDSLKNKKLPDFERTKPELFDDINHTIFHNKDGKYAWRPIQLIHPALYVSLVHKITEEKNWKTIRERFEKFSAIHHKIKCVSIPVVTLENKKTQHKQILQWWEKIEQQSIIMSLDYGYLTHADISNCYGALYTHSIAWAVHSREKAKKERNNKDLVGNIIDKHLRQISYGQTNGIPQGSILMDFIAEMVLGYIDLLLKEKIDEEKIEEYEIIRYRDDYRIFTNKLTDGAKIIKCLSEILIDFGMTLNPNKTKPTDHIISGSIKADKLYWIKQKQSMWSLQKHLLLIHNLSMEFSNCGSLMVALTKYYERIENKKKIKNDVLPLISIIMDIAYHNSRTYAVSTSIISKLISHIEKKEDQKKIIEKIRKKFNKIPNTGHLDIWLQRVVIGFDENIPFDEPICKMVVDGGNQPLWKSDWLKDSLKKMIDNAVIIDKGKLKESKNIPIRREEFSVFPKNY